MYIGWPAILELNVILCYASDNLDQSALTLAQMIIDWFWFSLKLITNPNPKTANLKTDSWTIQCWTSHLTLPRWKMPRWTGHHLPPPSPSLCCLCSSIFSILYGHDGAWEMAWGQTCALPLSPATSYAGEGQIGGDLVLFLTSPNPNKQEVRSYPRNGVMYEH